MAGAALAGWRLFGQPQQARLDLLGGRGTAVGLEEPFGNGILVERICVGHGVDDLDDVSLIRPPCVLGVSLVDEAEATSIGRR